jgi:signal transduction histidine kinase
MPADAAISAPAIAKILMVDDEPKNLLALEAVLESLGQPLVRARSGREASRCLLADDFAVILLDVQMPDMDGFEFAAMIRARERSRDIPIIFVTAAGKTEAEMFRGYEAGGIDYMLKPYSPAILRYKVGVLIKLYQKSAEVLRLNQQLGAINAGLERRIQERTAALEVHAEDLARSNQQLAVANRVKSQFVADMSHELRTPLNCINGFSEVLYDGVFGPLNEKQRNYAHNIMTSGKHLLMLINQVLDVSKMEAGKMGLTLAPVGLPALLQEVSTLLAGQLAKKRQSLSLKIPDGLPHVQADELKAREILFNLLANAIKFTPDHGSLGVRVCQAGPAVMIEVWDSGVGIAPEDLPRVCEGFFRVVSAQAPVTEGTGLGLALSKKLAELQGGSLTVESQGLGQGTVVRVLLPIAA